LAALSIEDRELHILAANRDAVRELEGVFLPLEEKRNSDGVKMLPGS
jgi:hypothetical protein